MELRQKENKQEWVVGKTLSERRQKAEIQNTIFSNCYKFFFSQ